MSRWTSDNPINQHIASRIHQRRTELSISRQTLAPALGVTWQQLQKYENAKNSISAAKLYTLAHELGVPVAWFYEGL